MKGVDQGPGIIIPEKNCAHCIMQETLCQWDLEGHAWSCKLCHKLKKPCRRFEEPSEKGKQRVEDKGEGAGPSKRPRVGPMSEWLEQRDGRRLRIPRWDPKSLRPSGLSTLAWERSRPSGRQSGGCIGERTTTASLYGLQFASD